MKTRSIWRSILIGFVVIALAASGSLAGADTGKNKLTRPNILVILGDDALESVERGTPRPALERTSRGEHEDGEEEEIERTVIPNLVCTELVTVH